MCSLSGLLEVSARSLPTARLPPPLLPPLSSSCLPPTATVDCAAVALSCSLLLPSSPLLLLSSHPSRWPCCRGAPADVRRPLKVARCSPDQWVPFVPGQGALAGRTCRGDGAAHGQVFERRHPPRGRVLGAERRPLGDAGPARCRGLGALSGACGPLREAGGRRDWPRFGARV